jgi:hypothetical protein
MISRAGTIPLRRERLVRLLSGGYAKVDMESLLSAAGSTATSTPK